MYRLNLARNLRTLVFLLVVLGILASATGLWWANHTGLPRTWRELIESTISKQGAYIKIGSLSYVPLRGIVASDVHVFSDALHVHELSSLERIVLDVDKTKLARGIVQITRIELKDATLKLPVDPKHPDQEVLEVTNANGSIYMAGNRRMEIRNATGTIEGIHVSFDARLIGDQNEAPPPTEEIEVGRRREALARIIQELNRWKFDRQNPPSVRIHLEGDANDHSTLIARMEMEASGIEKNNHRLESLRAEAEVTGDLLTIHSLEASDLHGSLNGHIDYNLTAREGRFDIASSLDVPSLLSAWLGLPPLEAVRVQGAQHLEAEGDFQLADDNIPQIQATGHLRCESVSIKEVPFRSLETAFSWRDNSLFLRDLHLDRKDGKANAKVLVQWPKVRLALATTLPVPVYRPFFTNVPLGKVLDDFSERKGADVSVKLEGRFDASDRFAWHYEGSGAVKNLNYKGVPVNAAQCSFTLNHNELDFHDGTVVFNYDDYALRKAFEGPREATATIGRIRYDAPTKVVQVQGVTGNIWAAPLVRLFAPKIADGLEQYRFHRPPSLKGSGIVDVTPDGRTALDIAFTSEHPADYRFLEKNLTLERPQAKVAIRGERVTVSDLRFETFSGPVAARIDYVGKGRLEGELNGSRLSLPDLATTYGFEVKGGGNLTGRIEFGINDGKVETLSGEGLLGIEKAELFAVPMFGPLTPLISNVLNDRTAGSERAKNAFFTFRIEKGILSTSDFQTSTTSLNFAGDGSINLKDRQVDMTMRMNARGLLGLITLPLRPFTGLFQFHGTGPLHETKWESVRFTSPPQDQNSLLLDPPRARIVTEEE